jgi:hypothetical protein
MLLEWPGEGLRHGFFRRMPHLSFSCFKEGLFFAGVSPFDSLVSAD